MVSKKSFNNNPKILKTIYLNVKKVYVYFIFNFNKQTLVLQNNLSFTSMLSFYMFFQIS